MFATLTLTLALALIGQAPNPDAVASPERQRQLLAAMHARGHAEPPAPMRRPAARTPNTPARYSYATSSRTAGYRAHNAQVAREVQARELQQAAIMAEQARQYRRDLPYMLENQRQMLNRQSELERNEILNRYLNGTGYVPSTNLAPRPANNGNMLPTP